MNTEKVDKFTEFSKRWEDIVDGDENLHEFLHPTYTHGSYCVGRGDECFSNLSNFATKDGKMREETSYNLAMIINDIPNYIKRLQYLQKSATEVYMTFSNDEFVDSSSDEDKS